MSNIHIIKLQPSPYIKVEQKIKTIDLRINDEKRQKIKINDLVKFVNTEDNNKVLVAKVINLYYFKSFTELYKELPLLKCGYTETDIDNAKPKDMEQYYSKEEMQQYGVVGIEIELLS